MYDYIFSRVVIHPDFIEENAIAPVEQLVCTRGYVQTIAGNVPPSNGCANPRYQWQLSTSGNESSWSTISNGVSASYQPRNNQSGDWYYRRLVINDCTGDTVSISNVSHVFITDDVAPKCEAGENLITCPGIPVAVGGNPTGSGGNGTLTYQWTFPEFLSDANISNPIATVNEATLFTVSVTDALGCMQIDQILVKPVKADAGKDQTFCIGDNKSFIIGKNTVSSDNISYLWSPSDAVDCSTCPATRITTAADVTLILNQRITMNNGATCDTKDSIQIKGITPPPPNFLGTDIVRCWNPYIQFDIGTDQFGDFAFHWSPNTYLWSDNASKVTFYSETYLPVPNPFTYIVTATNQGCVRKDTVKVAIIRADAGGNGCGPRSLGRDRGNPTATTYEWITLSGPDHITGPKDALLSYANATIGTTSEYQLKACFSGVCCTNEVLVGECGCGIDIEFKSNSYCPSRLKEDNWLSLTARVSSENGSNYEVNWTPCEGLDTCKGLQVNVLDGVHRVYTATLTQLSTGKTCYDTIEVNNPAFLSPYFEISGDCFFGDSIQLGLAPEANLNYYWSPNEYFQNATIANPIVALTDHAIVYSVTVTNTQNLCKTILSKQIARSNPRIDLIDSFQVCSGNVVTLGSGHFEDSVWQYQWTPINAPWQQGTHATHYNPKVLVATDMQFNVAITDTAGICTKFDSVFVKIMSTPQLTPAPNVVVCQGESVLIGSPPIGGLKYEWFPSAGLSCTDCAQPYASPDSSITYQVRVVLDGQECGGFDVDDVFVEVLPLPEFQLNDLVTCPGKSTELNPDNIGECIGCTYSWLSVVTEYHSKINYQENDEGEYWLTVTDRNGCSYTDTMKLSYAEMKFHKESTVLCVDDFLLLGHADNNPSITWEPSNNLSCSQCANPTFYANDTGLFTFFASLEIDYGSYICTIKDSILIRVIDPQPKMALDTLVCKNACITIGPQYDPNIDYMWLPSEGLSCDNCANPTVCPSESANYTLYTTPVAEKGCTGEASVFVSIKDVEIPSLHVDDYTICFGELDTFNAVLSPSGDYYYNWKPNNALNNQFLSEPIFNTNLIQVGNHTFTLEVTDKETGCAGIVDTFEVKVIQETGYILLDQSKEFDCETDTIVIKLSAIGEIDMSSVQWQSKGDGEILYSSSDSLVYVLGKKEYGEKYFEISVFALTSTCRDTISRQISFLYENLCCPVAVMSPIDTLCESLPVTVMLSDSLSKYSSKGKWYLSSGPGVLQEQLLIDGMFESENRLPGIYQLTYKFSNKIDGCDSLYIANIIIKKHPEAGIVTGEFEFCSFLDTTILLSDYLSGADLEGYWYSNKLNPEELNSQTGELSMNNIDQGSYKIYYIVPGNTFCATDSTSTILHILKSPNVDLGADLSVDCRTTKVSLTPEVENNQQYWWTTLNGIPIKDSLELVQFFDTSGLYVLHALDLSTGCIGSDTIQILQGPPAVDSVQTKFENNKCYNDNKGIIQIEDISGGTPPFSYSLSGPITTSNVSGYFDNLPSGVYQVKITDQNDCESIREFVIENPAPIMVKLEGDTVIHCQDTIILEAVTDLDPTEIEKISWYAGQKLVENATSLIEDLTDHKSSYYLVKILSKAGCEIETRVNMKVDNSFPYFAPNVFSPDFNGINDIFKLYFDDQVDRVLQFRVFDRWGALMCDQSEIDPRDSSFGWDGFHLGKSMSPGVYVWYAEFLGCDGQRVVVKGDVTLIR